MSKNVDLELAKVMQSMNKLDGKIKKKDEESKILIRKLDAKQAAIQARISSIQETNKESQLKQE